MFAIWRNKNLTLLDENEGGIQADSQWIGFVWLKISVLLFSGIFFFEYSH
jgi:hypothetical protein